MTTRASEAADNRPAPDVAVAGAVAARRLVREVLTTPSALRRVDIVAPGGHGKTVLLEALADAFEGVGTPVHRGLPAPGAPVDPESAVLVDDAHLLTPDELQQLTALATGPDGYLVVAHRPWPRPTGTAALGAALAARRPPVVLDPLDRPGVAARAALQLGERAEPMPAAALDAVHQQTAGLPMLVDRLLAAVLDKAGPDRSRLQTVDPNQLPAGLLAQLGYLVQSQPAGVRELLLACALGAPLDPEVLVPLLGLPDADGAGALDELTEAARAAGLLTAAGRAVPLVSAAVLARTPPAARSETRRALAELELNRGGSVLSAARSLLGTGTTGARVAAVFTAAGEEAMRSGGSAGEFFAAAAAAGTPSLELAARRAEAAVLDGDLDLALAQADQVLSASTQVPSADVVQAGTVAAAVLARRGLLARSADLYRWLGSEQMGSGAVLAVPALIGTGALDEARELLRGPVSAVGRPPTLLAGAEELMAQGVYDSVAGSPTAALSQLTRATALLESSHRAALLPDTPAALAALVAVHCGELDVAQSVLERAERVRLGGRSAAIRHRLLLGWIALFRGATNTARSALASASPPGRHLEPRDEFLAAALEVALARRAGDLASLMPAWGRAREAIVRHPVDLFVLQQLGELSIAATRLRESSWVRPHLDEAAELLASLGDPALWAAPLHWSALQAAILSESRESAQRHADALEAAAGASRYAAAMASAAPHWVRLLDAEVDPDAVEAAARGLHAVGLAWEGGKLAGQAAIRTRDRKAMSSLLGCARALQSSGPVLRAPAVEVGDAAADTSPDAESGAAAPAVEPATVTEEPGDGPLSDREREVAALVLEGMTYKQIGEQLFISAKTVEHHVARMRQRLGSGSRGELFAHLRQIVGTPTPDA
ncbi:helix-turn-helix transcriptional regulator [Pseudonocardia sp. GCM10023141]|uniref:helix-turn-helix transcriptional regulator n=1 Tax=Pseudonocardia sp. GCM10023141 TaxID=3252653 RepID=UPI00360F19F9